MKKRKQRHVEPEELFSVGGITYQRVRLVMEVDVPMEAHDTPEGQRAQFNQGAMTLIGHVESSDGESMFPRGCRVVLVTSEEVEQ
jgi:hypothetical protein